MPRRERGRLRWKFLEVVASVRKLRIMLAASALAISAIGMGASGVLAYGHADQPLAQLELSANCTNRESPYCSPEALGLGGIWFWIEIDSGGTGDIAGSGCQHLPGVFGGALQMRGEITWEQFTGSLGDLQTAHPGIVAVGSDPHGEYYVVPAVNFAFPMTDGHYTLTLDKGVFLQAQVAP
jgi:hypothetical protein